MFSLQGYHDGLKREMELAQEAYCETAVDSAVDLLLLFMHKLQLEVSIVDLSTKMEQALDAAGKAPMEFPSVHRLPDANAFLASLRDPETGEMRPHIESISIFLKNSVIIAITTFGIFPDVHNDELAFQNAINVTFQKLTAIWRKRAALWIAQPDAFDQVRRNAIRPWSER